MELAAWNTVKETLINRFGLLVPSLLYVDDEDGLIFEWQRPDGLLAVCYYMDIEEVGPPYSILLHDVRNAQGITRNCEIVEILPLFNSLVIPWLAARGITPHPPSLNVSRD